MASCQQCTRPFSDGLKCSEICGALYCSDACKRTDWATHKTQHIRAAPDDPSAYDILSTPPDQTASRRPSLEVYGPPPTVLAQAFFMWKGPMRGRVPGVIDGTVTRFWPESPQRLENVPSDKVPSFETDTFRIAYSMYEPAMSVRRPLTTVMMMHGVPSNRRAKREVALVLARLGCRVFAIDMLGMGESDQVHDYGGPDDVGYDWINDTLYLAEMIPWLLKRHGASVPDGRFVYQADDWGTGIQNHFVAAHPEMVLMAIKLNGVELDGYEIEAIRAIGNTAAVARKNPTAFAQAANGIVFDMWQTMKNMVESESGQRTMNAYGEQDLLFPYRDVDVRSGEKAGDRGTLPWNLGALTRRADRLGPRQTLPHDGEKNVGGPRYDLMRTDKYGPVPWEIIWGMLDQMMPPAQMDRLAELFTREASARVGVMPIEGGDHFIEMDKPMAVAATMMRAMRREFGASEHTLLPFLGIDGVVWKGDERSVIKSWRGTK